MNQIGHGTLMHVCLQGESNSQAGRPAPRGRRGRGGTTAVPAVTPRRGSSRQTAQQATARVQQHTNRQATAFVACVTFHSMFRLLTA